MRACQLFGAKVPQLYPNKVRFVSLEMFLLILMCVYPFDALILDNGYPSIHKV
jgi:hypothetical protein